MENTISTKDLKAKLDRKDAVTVVETLAPERYREAHLPGALNIPPDKIKELAPHVLPNKNAQIVPRSANPSAGSSLLMRPLGWWSNVLG